LWLGGCKKLEMIAGSVNQPGGRAAISRASRLRDGLLGRLSGAIVAGVAATALIVGGTFLDGAAIGGAASAVAQQGPAFGSAQAAIEGGLGAYQAGRRDAAIAALGEAAARGDASERFVAEFYLARLYAEDPGGSADHPKAFVLYRKLADENVDVDPETSQRAPFVAKALIALAGYLRTGIKEIDLAPNPARAADYLNHAAVFFGDKDAQFELARASLAADGPSDDVRRGLHYLSALTEASYAPAQALLAELFWRGRHVKQDERRALALVTMAAEGAPAHERIWIEDTYATIFCAAAQPAREEAGRLVAQWRKMFAAPGPEPSARMSLGARELLPERQCASGEKVALTLAAKAPEASPAVPPPSLGLLKPAPLPATGFRAAGFAGPATAKK
jgi:exopolysaccharide production negative regulator